MTNPTDRPGGRPWTSAAPPLLLLALAGGCASAVRDAATAATPAVVHAALHEANEPDEQKQIGRLADSEGLRHVGRSIGEGVGIGLFNQANELSGVAPDAKPTAGGATQPAATGPTTKPAGGVPNGATPGAAAVASLAGGGGGLNGFVQSSVQQAFLAATDPRFKEGERALAEAVGEGFVQGTISVVNKQGPAIGDTVRRQLGPIVQDLMREQVAPAMRDMIHDQLGPVALDVWRQGAVDTLKLTVRPDLQPDVTRNAENASIGASRGTHQALIESGTLTADGSLNPRLRVTLWAGGVLIALVGVAALTLLVMLNLLALHHWRHRRRAGGKG